VARAAPADAGRAARAGAHVGIRGLALPDADALETPLGRISIDPLAVTLGVPVSSSVHAREHSLEVQLPFLQAVLGDFTLVPLAVGHADRAEVARVLDAAWEDTAGDKDRVVGHGAFAFHEGARA
jgi:AmmeMemoRadiSam system protein B